MNPRTHAEARALPWETLAAIENAAMWAAMGHQGYADSWLRRAGIKPKDTPVRANPMAVTALEQARRMRMAGHQAKLDACLAAITGEHLTRDIADRLGWDMERTDTFLRSLHREGLVDVRKHKGKCLWSQAAKERATGAASDIPATPSAGKATGPVAALSGAVIVGCYDTAIRFTSRRAKGDAA